MGKSDKARRDREAIRAHYEKKYAGRLDEAQAAIKQLTERCSELEAETAACRKKIETDAGTIRQQDLLIARLQEKLELSPGALEEFRNSLDAAHEAAAVSRAANMVLDEMSRTFRQLGVLPEHRPYAP